MQNPAIPCKSSDDGSFAEHPLRQRPTIPKFGLSLYSTLRRACKKHVEGVRNQGLS